MVFDVIIPVYKPDAKLDLLIKALLSQAMGPYSILLLITRDGNEEALAEKLLKKDKRIRAHFIEKKDYDHAATRNLGVSMTDKESEFFLLMTQDAVPADAHLTERLISCFEDEKTAAAYARQLSGKMAGIPEKCARRFNYPAQSRKKTLADLDELGIKTYFCSNVCAMYRRSVFDALGGFSAPAIFNEDMVYAAAVLKKGYNIVYNAEACVTHWHEYGLKMQFRRSFDNGVSQAIHSEVFDGVKPSKEGTHFVKMTVRTLRRVKQSWHIPYFILQCAFRYIGFYLGKKYTALPPVLREKFSLNRTFWEGTAYGEKKWN